MALPAEGSSNPYWSEEADEAPRVQRILNIVARQPDANRIAFVVAKSNNDNFVAYRFDTDSNSIKPFWISTENVLTEERTDLNLAERMLYGVETRVTPTGEWLVNIAAEELKSRVMNLTLSDDDVPSLVGTVDGCTCIVEYAYVQMRKGLIPDVDWIRLTGKEVATGKTRTELIRR